MTRPQIDIRENEIIERSPNSFLCCLKPIF